MLMTIETAGTGRDLLRALAWFSPAFPVGAFSYSHGLEYAVERGLVGDRASLGDWVEGVIARGAGRIDAALLRAAYDGIAFAQKDELAWALERGDAMRATRELAGESFGQGEAFLATVRAAWPHPDLDRLAALAQDAQRRIAYPVAVGAAAAAHGLSVELALTAYLHALAANLVSAGIRLIPLGQTDGQRTMAALEPVVLAAIAASRSRARDDVGAAAPVVDWASAQHETQYTRLFRS